MRERKGKREEHVVKDVCLVLRSLGMKSSNDDEKEEEDVDKKEGGR